MALNVRLHLDFVLRAMGSHPWCLSLVCLFGGAVKAGWKEIRQQAVIPVRRPVLGQGSRGREQKVIKQYICGAGEVVEGPVLYGGQTMGSNVLIFQHRTIF